MLSTLSMLSLCLRAARRSHNPRLWQYGSTMSFARVTAAVAALLVLFVSLAVCLFAMLVVAGPHGMITLPDWLAAIAGFTAWGLPFFLAYRTWRGLTARQAGRSRR